MQNEVLAYRSLFVLNYLAKNSVTTLKNPPYSLDLRLADFLLFLWLKIIVLGENLVNTEVVKQNVTKPLKE